MAEKCPILVSVLLAILKRETRSERLLGCLELAKCLDAVDYSKLRNEIASVNQMEKDFESNLEIAKQLAEAKTSLNNKRTALVHIWRELGQLYTANASISGRENVYAEAPRMAARYLCDGGSIELVDGDACEVNETWIKDVLGCANTFIEKQLGREAKVKYFVII